MKKCPYCAEEIQDEAIKCKHCMEFLDGSTRHLPPALPTAPVPALPFYFKTSFIVLTFLMMPPFILPSIWWHPKLHFVWKIVITVAVIAISWLFVELCRNLMDTMQIPLNMMKDAMKY